MGFSHNFALCSEVIVCTVPGNGTESSFIKCSWQFVDSLEPNRKEAVSVVGQQAGDIVFLLNSKTSHP